MKIPSQFPQFTDVAALLIVTGKQGAEFYLGHSGELVEAGAFDIPAAKYSDKEGFFAGRGGASGSVKETDKAGHTKEFLKRLETELKKMISKRRKMSVYVYAPEYLMPQVKVLVKKLAGEQYAMSFIGNYLKTHPKKLLEMLEVRVERKAAKKKVVRTSKEAAKMLKR